MSKYIHTIYTPELIEAIKEIGMGYTEFAVDEGSKYLSQAGIINRRYQTDLPEATRNNTNFPKQPVTSNDEVAGYSVPTYDSPLEIVPYVDLREVSPQKIAERAKAHAESIKQAFARDLKYFWAAGHSSQYTKARALKVDDNTIKVLAPDGVTEVNALAYSFYTSLRTKMRKDMKDMIKEGEKMHVLMSDDNVEGLILSLKAEFGNAYDHRSFEGNKIDLGDIMIHRTTRPLLCQVTGANLQYIDPASNYTIDADTREAVVCWLPSQVGKALVNEMMLMDVSAANNGEELTALASGGGCKIRKDGKGIFTFVSHAGLAKETIVA